MKTVEEYAIDLICDGTLDAVEQPHSCNASADVSASLTLAADLARAIRANPAVVLALVGRGTGTPEETR